MDNCQLPKGYKNTEVGVIPEDWSIESVKNLALIKTGSRNTQDRIESGEYPFFVRSQIVERINSYSYDGEAVLTAGDGVGVGKVMHYINGKFDCHQRVYRISDFKEKISGYYFYLYFSNHFLNRIMQMTAKSSVDSVRMDMIANMQIPIPPTVEEQTAIATALSDTDALINSLSTLIAKKRNIKQGAMQKLLQPKEGWEVKKLGDFLDYEQPTEYLVTDTEYNDNNQIPVLTAGKTFILGYTNEEHGIFKNLPVIIFDDFTTAIKYVDFPFKAKSSAMKMLLPKNEKVNLRFIFEIMLQIKYQVADHKRHWIGEYSKIEIKVPSTPEEQNEIATILSDMDAEIQALETKLEKYRKIKLGMMQNLLTGKIRLIDN
jgi:type I restriction enzyme S subunit